ncbi:MAG: 3-deoxy-D-manno-octulosonic acid transferase, partial [Phaeodactylibacter sp.]|nr:3-deoxy-D-manno-octulosonic acid transferase [Phaeodactylibacter sp.]
MPRRIRPFLDAIRPDRAVFVKYEFWFNTLQALAARRVPTLLISGIFRPKQFFFQWYGGYFRKQLRHFEHFFVQDEASVQLLQQHGFSNCTRAGDTRIDR